MTEWTLAQDAVPVQGTPDPFLIEDEPLTFVADRVLEPGDQVLLTLQFTIDRPGTWVLDLFGSSSIEIAIPWSIHAEDVDLDEPSSASEPRALVARGLPAGHSEWETDCWSFQLALMSCSWSNSDGSRCQSSWNKPSRMPNSEPQRVV